MSELIDTLRRDVEQLATPAGRRVGTRGHEVARQYLLGRLKELGLVPYCSQSLELPYTGGGKEFCNLVGVVPGTNRWLQPLLIGAHYDSVIDSYCADDNAAAVAIALSAAQALSAAPVSRDVVIALFDAEEPPYFHSALMGSTRFYEDEELSSGFAAALIMDLVGHDVDLGQFQMLGQNLADLLFVTGAESHSDLASVVQSASAQSDLPVVATLNLYVGDMSDHHVFRTHGVPFLFFSCGHWPHYHQETDTPDRLNYTKMSRICRLLVDWTRKLAGKRLADEHAAPDTVDLEIELLKRAFGPKFLNALPALGLRELESREDIDRLVQILMGQFRL